MKTLFIPVKSKSQLNLPKITEVSKRLPRNIAIAYSIQFIEIAGEIKKILSKNHKITGFMQVLGCSKPTVAKGTEAILLVGEGRFHALSLAKETKLPIYSLEHNQLKRISGEEIGIFEKRKKAAYLKFLHANSVGVLVSVKPGQSNLKKALKFRKNFKTKNSYLFLCNDIVPEEFENFQLNSWVNTACPRMDMASPSIINAENLNY